MIKFSTTWIRPGTKRTDIELQFGKTFEWKPLLAKIGGGTKVHRVAAMVLEAPDGYIIWSASSLCGSQRWVRGGKSRIFLFPIDDISKVTCDKCLGIRTPGGKTPPPTKHRVPIDPETRPKRYFFNVKTETKDGRIMEHREDARGMTPEEAIKKITRQLMGYYWNARIFDFELTKIYAWNEKLLWKKSLT